MRKEVFEEGEYYHIYNRGVDQRSIFLDDSDRLRFVNSIYLLNNFLEIPYRFNVRMLNPKEQLVPIKPYVKIVAGCLMTNHYHLALSPLQKNGVSRLLHKLGTSYTKYFNIKHERKGRLFESTFKAKHVDRQEYALYLTQYIHLNPIKLFQAKLGTKKILQKLEKYPWSSLPDYLGRTSHFSLALSSDFQKEVLDIKENEYRQYLKELFQA